MTVHESVHEREARWQRRWKSERAFEPAPDGREKFFGTFPYPYVNGLPHVGHLFSIMRTEAFARYHRLRGRNTLFAQGFHATGSPITTAALRVAENDEKQIKILKDLGVADADIPKFAEPEFWISYFAPRYKEDLTSVGLSIDWRRSFHTTSLNPQYDAFIRWQFEILKEKGYVQQGEHPVVWCPKEQCPVSDHARSVGEGETPQEFLLVKHKLDDGSFIVSATLRPDTILGVTNLYVNPKTSYTQLQVGDEIWIANEPTAQRLAEQGHPNEIIGTIEGKELIGKMVKEFSGLTVPILPATFLDAKAGTGLVHSVPSDSADDLIALRDLQADEKMMREYGLNVTAIRAIEPIPVLETEGHGQIPAQKFLDEHNVKSQQDKKKLEEIRKELYKLSFYSATFNEKYAKYDLAGVPVQEGKEKIKNIIIEAGWGVPYYQLTGRVVCRCQTESIVKIVSDQWFLTYANPEWKKLAHEALDQMKLYPESVRTQFDHVLDWLQDWACTREFGLGTRLPWDERWLIESLSDSTIYMAYYTIAHHIKDVDAALLTRDFFDYVFLGKETKHKVPNAEGMRNEFLYWYPMDFRNSGKDLVQNHLSFMLFNHCAIFPKELWPRGIGVNGWVMVNGQKMSKSLGNVIPVRELVKEFGADATRITILNGGEGLDDPNWDSNFARGMQGKLEHLIRIAEDIAGLSDATSEDEPMDAWLQLRCNDLIIRITDAMELTNFRTALQLALFEYNSALRWYRERAGPSANASLLREYLSYQLTMLSPFIPHACEQAWETLGNEGLCSLSRWPEIELRDDLDGVLLAEGMIEQVTEQLRKGIEGKSPTSVRLFLSAAWKREAMRVFDEHVGETRNPKELLAKIATGDLKKHGEELQRLILFLVKSRVPGPIMDEEMERAALASAKEYLERIAGCALEIHAAGETDSKRADAGLPGRPALEIISE